MSSRSTVIKKRFSFAKLSIAKRMCFYFLNLLNSQTYGYYKHNHFSVSLLSVWLTNVNFHFGFYLSLSFTSTETVVAALGTRQGKRKKSEFSSSGHQVWFKLLLLTRIKTNKWSQLEPSFRVRRHHFWSNEMESRDSQVFSVGQIAHVSMPYV